MHWFPYPLSGGVVGGRSAPRFAKSFIAENFALLTHIEIYWLFVYVHYGPFAKNNSILGVSV